MGDDGEKRQERGGDLLADVIGTLQRILSLRDTLPGEDANAEIALRAPDAPGTWYLRRLGMVGFNEAQRMAAALAERAARGDTDAVGLVLALACGHRVNG